MYDYLIVGAGLYGAVFARQLADAVVSVPPFAPIPPSALEEALRLMARCRRIINAGLPDAAMDTPLGDLVRKAEGMPGYEK